MLTNFADDLGIVGNNQSQGTIVLPTAKLRTYQTIRKAILSGTFPPGSHLREEELSELCNTSRTPVRQAIRRLADEGLVAIAANKRSYVADVDETHAEEIFDLLAFLESYLAGLAAVRITPEKLAELQTILDLQKQLIATDPEDDQRFLELNIQFHRLIHQAGGSPILLEIASRVENFTQSLYLKHGRATENAGSVDQHEQLFNALASGDKTRSELLMRLHVESVRKECREIWLDLNGGED
jgi:DNA-binding GntR family transcriptional regulator